MIPAFVDIASLWQVLPPGIHDASLEEVEARFAGNDRRKRLFEGFRKAAEALRAAGCKAIYLDGSFVTGNPTPGDFDACWEDAGVDERKLEPVLLDFSAFRQAQKSKFQGELFPAGAAAAVGRTFIDFFQTDKYTGRRKGIIRIRL